MLDHLTNLNLETLLQSMTPLSCLLIGILSIPHCSGMCGPLSMTVADKKNKLILYQIGRLAGYCFVVLLGSLVGHIFIKKMSPYLQVGASILLSITFIIIGINIFRGKNVNFEFKALSKLHFKIVENMRSADVMASFIVGLSSVLLPCGLLYAVLAGLVAMNNFAMAFICVFLFWLGSAPATFFAPQIFRKVISPLVKKSPKLIGFTIIAIATIGLTHRVKKISYVGDKVKTEQEKRHSCH